MVQFVRIARVLGNLPAQIVYQLGRIVDGVDGHLVWWMALLCVSLGTACSDGSISGPAVTPHATSHRLLVQQFKTDYPTSTFVGKSCDNVSNAQEFYKNFSYVGGASDTLIYAPTDSTEVCLVYQVRARYSWLVSAPNTTLPYLGARSARYITAKTDVTLKTLQGSAATAGSLGYSVSRFWFWAFSAPFSGTYEANISNNGASSQGANREGNFMAFPDLTFADDVCFRRGISCDWQVNVAVRVWIRRTDETIVVGGHQTQLFGGSTVAGDDFALPPTLLTMINASKTRDQYPPLFTAKTAAPTP